MAIHDTLANALSCISNMEKTGKSELVVKPASKLIGEVLKILKKEKYIDDYQFVDNNRGGAYRINLNGTINKIGVIKPRFAVKLTGIEKFEKRYLPAKDFGRIILSTPKGILTHLEAAEKNTGGTLIAYVY